MPKKSLKDFELFYYKKFYKILNDINFVLIYAVFSAPLQKIYFNDNY